MEEIIIQSVILSLWLAYSYIEGRREAYYYYLKIKTYDLQDFDEHPMFLLQRGIVGIGFVLATFGWASVFDLAALALMFPFIHDGAYYTKRNDLNPDIYKRRWFDHSTTSTARLTKYFTPFVRNFWFASGVVLWICLLIY